MKKITVIAVLFLVTFAASAQSQKINKTNIVGKWGMFAVEVPGQMYYNIEKDSLVLSQEIKTSVDDASELPMMVTMLKQQFSLFKKMSFLFNANGTSEVITLTGEKEQGSYVVDEIKSTIVSAKKDKAKPDVLSSVTLEEGGQKMHMTAQQSEGEVKITLKKIS